MSVHYEIFPDKDKIVVNKDLEDKMDLSISIVKAGRAARTDAKIKVRIPIQEAIIVCSEDQQKQAEYFLSEIKEELNVKNIKFQTEFSKMVDYSLKPIFKLLGPAFKKDAPDIGEAIKKLSGKAAQNAVNDIQNKKSFEIKIGSANFTILDEHVEISSSGKEGYSDAAFNGGQIFINTQLTPKLIQEGLVRDIIRRIQSMRKEANLEYTQNIMIIYKGDNETKEAINEWLEYIKTETLAISIKTGTTKEGITTDWEIDGKNISLTIIPLKNK
ncbi:MAG: hypothetical protein FK731_12115 [Asgard group archaeon]|nr:hypothetical protein [Asgard group archaeon]